MHFNVIYALSTCMCCSCCVCGVVYMTCVCIHDHGLPVAQKFKAVYSLHLHKYNLLQKLQISNEICKYKFKNILDVKNTAHILF